MYTIDQHGYLMELSGSNSKEFWNTYIFMQRAITFYLIQY